MIATTCCAGLKRAPPPLMNPLKPRVPVGPKPSKKMKSFFWDKLPDARIDGTFWEGHGPAYSDMPTAEVGLVHCIPLTPKTLTDLTMVEPAQHADCGGE